MHRVDIIINRHDSSYNDKVLYIYKVLRTNTSCTPLIWFKYDDWQEGTNEIYWKEEYEGYFDSPYDHIVALRKSPIKENQSLAYKDIHGELELTTHDMTDKSLRLVNYTESKRKAGLIWKNPRDASIRICTTKLEMNIQVEFDPQPSLLLVWGENTFSEGTPGSKYPTGPACKLNLPENPWDSQGSKNPPSVTFSMEHKKWTSTTCSVDLVAQDAEIAKAAINSERISGT